MGKRIFLALPISRELKNEILSWERGFQNLPVRWLRGKNLHITLVPPWETDDSDKIVTLLNLKGATGIIELNFSRVTFGPNPREPRLIWAEGSTTPQLLKLKSALDVALGREPDPRPFKLHLTLARFRPENFHSCQSKTLNEAVAWRDTATSFVLMESHLLAGGADYEVLAEIPL
ncbi:2'-5' RNA ligase [Candidatus Uhrbacteria bacterium RIFCSPHIGHO2_12_FULL_54_23]|uniref:RNA 2',3'-cyclic phosphodiesterase n=3 Tax=Candidatus Uhriibacteriota TaxID=1752732 RepID=A0A1F7UH98_9BACT|nr:MAG: 2'-5' RNA ligase [Candidatus Uhrbacteria bacterium RIFCSPHIGHO2_12_FULL_54_23]OGL85507.1 MAG: 2'-5' RNA ligase [Candidatus Uhrbacteria bacterium RIFCSPLOWO2_01_FULL_55_36]OGL89638.1 MAG: 2'-5' RNA ligase [Candidatus Uhrbacteria bacterium RIFCSPLOWO2_02_FULL_54_37]